MTDLCIGTENKDKISQLETDFKLLKKDMEHMQKTTVSVSAWHEFQRDLDLLKSDIREMKNNREEDRAAIRSLSESISELSSRLEEYLAGNLEILSNQKVAEKEQEIMKDDIGEIKKMILGLSKDIDENNIWNQIKAISDKSKIHKWLIRAIFGTIIMMFLASATFIFGGGLTLPDILDFLKGVIM